MDFVAIDVETANARLGSICSIGLVGWTGGREAISFHQFIDPLDWFDGFNVSLHGISEATVSGSPSFGGIVGQLESLVGENILVSHSAFDRVAITQAYSAVGLAVPNFRWLDTVRVARRAWPERGSSSCRLLTLAQEFGIELEHHQALSDARAAARILALAVEKTGISPADWLDRVRLSVDGRSARIAVAHTADGILTGEVVVITGELCRPRREIAETLAAAGADVEPGVTHRTTILVLGDQDVSKFRGAEKSRKHQKAEKLIQEGTPLRLISESDLDAMVRLQP